MCLFINNGTMCDKYVSWCCCLCVLQEIEFLLRGHQVQKVLCSCFCFFLLHFIVTVNVLTLLFRATDSGSTLAGFLISAVIFTCERNINYKNIFIFSCNWADSIQVKTELCRFTISKRGLPFN